MRVLIVAAAARQDSLARPLRDSGHEASTASARDVSAEVVRARPELLVAEIEGDNGAAMRRLIERARAVSEHRLPVLLLLPESSHWLHGALPAELMPARALPSSNADGDSLRRALNALVAFDDATAAAPIAGGELQLDRLERLATGPAGSARLTASEATLLAMIVDGGGAVVTAERIAEGLWGSADMDRYARAAIRSHMHTLRRKLRTIGLGEAIVSLPGVGYRLARPGEGESIGG